MSSIEAFAHLLAELADPGAVRADVLAIRGLDERTLQVFISRCMTSLSTDDAGAYRFRRAHRMARAALRRAARYDEIANETSDVSFSFAAVGDR